MFLGAECKKSAGAPSLNPFVCWVQGWGTTNLDEHVRKQPGLFYFLLRRPTLQPSLMVCLARPNASASSGTSSVMHDPAAI
jgi:hypothetical protein